MSDEAKAYPQPGQASKVIEEEFRRLGVDPASQDAPWALCLSGGGIRSATFSLGVLQGLAERGLLSKFHYLSTVSGGGYVGSWLSRWIAEERASQPQSDPVARVESALGSGIEPEPVRRLRAYSNYLSPVWGASSDLFALVSIFLRNLVLNWTVLVPLLLAIALFPQVLANASAMLGVAGWNLRWMLAGASLLLCAGIAFVVVDLPGPRPGKGAGDRTDRFLWACFLPIAGAALLVATALPWIRTELRASSMADFALWGASVHAAGCIVGVMARLILRMDDRRGKTTESVGQILADLAFILASGALGGAAVHALARSLPDRFPPLLEPAVSTMVNFPSLLLCFWLATSIYAALCSSLSDEGEREWWARSGGWWIKAALAWSIGCVLSLHVPAWLGLAPGSTLPVAVGGGLWGLLVAAGGYWAKNGAQVARQVRSFGDRLGANLLDLAALAFLVVLLVLSSVLAQWCVDQLALPKVDPRRAGPVSVKDLSDMARAVEVQARRIERMEERATTRILRDAAEHAGTLERAASVFVGSEEEVRKATEAASAAAEAAARAKSAQAKRIARTDEDAQLADDLAERTSEALLAVQGRSGRAILEQQAREDARWRTEEGYVGVSILFLAGLLAFAALASRFVGVNTFSLHGMYGNRLVRAYFGSARPSEKRHPHRFTGFDPADNIGMQSLAPDGKAPMRLFHVVNLALNLVSPSKSHLHWQQRKAAAFTVTPLHAGSDAVGYQPSATYSGDEGISLGRAMTISGAAASPNMGYHSSPAVTLVMALLNLRLGWWLPNPGRPGSEIWKRREPPFSLSPLCNEALGRTGVDSPYVYLSDGGHFDNLGLYEMVRRGCRKILVVDASADPATRHEDLQDTIRKIRVDMGVDIDFPEHALQRGKRVAMALIAYPGGGTGELVYLKPAYRGHDEPPDVRFYAEESRAKDGPDAFPHQTTADQFFDESQFESYRQLGLLTVRQLYYGPESLVPDGKDWPDYRRYCGTLSPPVDGTAPGHDAAPGRPGELPGIDGIANAVQSMGQGAMLATAITVGGVVGVTGTVALKESTVSLKPGSEVTLKAPPGAAPVPPPAPGSGITQVTLTADEQLRKSLETLIGSAEKLAEAGRLQKETGDGLKATLEELKKLAAKLPPAVSAQLSAEDRDRLAALSNQLARFSTDPKADKTGIAEVLEKIRTSLGEIEKAVTRLTPPRNVRGIEGGGR